MDEFNELEFGTENEGMPKAKAIAAVHPTFEAWAHGRIDAAAYPDAENLRHILGRFHRGMMLLFQDCNQGAVPCVVVTHSGLLDIIMKAARAHPIQSPMYWLIPSPTWRLDRSTSHSVHNCDINALEFRYVMTAANQLRQFNLLRIGMDDDVRHLAPHLQLLMPKKSSEF
jgi:broad specificity phosphatase PhoE